MMIDKQFIKLAFQLYFQEKKASFIRKLPFSRSYKETYAFKNYFWEIRIATKLKEVAFRNFFGPYASGVLFNTANGWLVSDPGDIEINSKLGNWGQYDLNKIQYLSSLIDPSSTVYVLGTHIGTLLIPLAKISGKIIGFEANPKTFRYLEYNLPLNWIDNTTIFNVGLYDESGTVSFYHSKANTGGSKIKPVNDQFIYNYDNPDEIKIETVCLDEFCESQDLPLPDLMVVDIEGAEYRALKKAEKCLKHTTYLYVEFIPHHLSDVAGIDLRTFLSVIQPFFRKMKIVGAGEHAYEGEQIYNVLNSLWMSQRGVDLLFIK